MRRPAPTAAVSSSSGLPSSEPPEARQSPAESLARARRLGHDVTRLFSVPIPVAAPDPGLRAAAGTLPDATATVRRVLVSQVVPQVPSDGGAPTIAQIHVVGRPEKVFGDTMGDHTTAFAVHRVALIQKLLGKTFEEAFDVITDLYGDAAVLPGMSLRGSLPETHARRLDEAENELRDLLDLGDLTAMEDGDQEPDPDPADLQQAMSAYMEFRELVPLSAINVKAKSPVHAGKGKGEASAVDLLAQHQAGDTKSEKALLEAIGKTYDVNSSAMAIVERNPTLLGRMVPGLDPALSFDRRMTALVSQHVSSLESSFPAVYDIVDPDDAEAELKQRLLPEMDGWMVAQGDELRHQAELRTEWISQERANRVVLRAGSKLQGEKTRLIRRYRAERTDFADQLRQLDTAYQGYFGHRLPKEQAEEVAEVSVPGESHEHKKRKVAEITTAPVTVETLVDPDEEAEKEERKSPLATQLVLAEDGTIDELVSAGRSPSPFVGTMGAHSTAWIVHLDRVRRAVEGVSVRNAARAIAQTLVRQAKASRLRREKDGHLPIDHTLLLDDAESRLDEFPAKLKKTPRDLRLYVLQEYVNAYLTYVNYLPGATLDKADTGAKNEGTWRGILRRFEAGEPQTLGMLRAAVQGLFDVTELSPEAEGVLRQEHARIIQETYPLAYAAVFEDDPTGLAPEPDPGKKRKRSVYEADAEWSGSD